MNTSASLQTDPIIGRDIVIISLHPWYFEMGCSAKNIAEELSANNRVLYVNFQIKRKSFFSKIPDKKIKDHISLIKEKGEQIKQVKQGLWQFYPFSFAESINWIKSNAVFNYINKINNRRFAKEIKKAIKTLGFNDVIFINDNDIYNGFYLKELLNPSLYIYHRRDYLPGYAYWKLHTSILEPLLMKKADLIIANSISLAERSQQVNPNAYYIGQGCDLSNFKPDQPYNRPADLPEGSLVVGYIGALDADRLDFDILKTIANSNSTWQVVLVGPEDDAFKNSDLHSFKNIHFLGRKPFAELPAYSMSFDVCINPHLVNEITFGNYPLKIDEYLAMGKPTVATRTAAMKLFEDYVYLANHPNEYPTLIQKAFSEHNAEKKNDRINFAQSHSWKNCMTAIYSAINNYMSIKN